MALKKVVTERAVRELYGIMSTEHFSRLSGVLWRLLNERQQAAVGGAGGDVAAMEARIRQLEAKAQRLQTKMDALEGMVSRAKGGGA